MGKWIVVKVGGIDEGGLRLTPKGELIGDFIGEYSSLKEWITSYASPYEISGLDVFEQGGAGRLGIPTSPAHLYELWAKEEAEILEECIKKVETESDDNPIKKVFEWEGELFLFFKGDFLH